jgi:hypothetical protein
VRLVLAFLEMLAEAMILSMSKDSRQDDSPVLQMSHLAVEIPLFYL